MNVQIFMFYRISYVLLVQDVRGTSWNLAGSVKLQRTLKRMEKFVM